MAGRSRTPNLPGRPPEIGAEARREFGAAFRTGGRHYDAVRPSYPVAAVDFMLPPRARAAVDIGAGTGILTALVASRGVDTTAVDPSADMLDQLRHKLPGTAAVEATGEDTGLPAGSYDVVLCAQAWHWMDAAAASREAARILRPAGTLSLVWNQLDVTVPWVHRLSRIMHAGDVHRPEFRPGIGPEFATPESLHVTWEQRVLPEDIMGLARSRSYYLRSAAPVRERVEANLRWYLFEHLGHRPGQPLGLPYYTHAWRAPRLGASEPAP